MGEFRTLLRSQREEDLPKWIDNAIAPGLPETECFCDGLRRDKAAIHPAVSGPKGTPLFWFTASEILAPRDIHKGSRIRQLPRFLLEPGLILKPIWASLLSREVRVP